MLDVNVDGLSKFIDNLLGLASYSDMDIKEKDDLRQFLLDFMTELYSDKVDDMTRLLDQIETFNPFMVKLAMGYGIMEPDAVDMVKVLFIKINEYFYKKGSFEVLKNVSRVFSHYGIDTKIHRVQYDKVHNVYKLQDVWTGEYEDSSFDEYITPGHLVLKDDYSYYTFTDEYTTIVVHIKIILSPQVSEKMSYPVSLLHAYSVTIHRNDTIQFPIFDDVYNLRLQDYLDFLRYFYFKYLQVRHPDFDIQDSVGLEMWDLYMTSDDDVEAAKLLLIDLLGEVYMSRDGLAYYLRASTQILNKRKLEVLDKTVEDIGNHVASINGELKEKIDQFMIDEEFIDNVAIMYIYARAYVDTLPDVTDLDKAVQATILYLFQYIMWAMMADFVEMFEDLVDKFKRYYLPIYTQFFYEVDESLVIKNNYYRIFLDDYKNITVDMKRSSLIDTGDRQYMEVYTARRDWVELLDSARRLISLNKHSEIHLNDLVVIVWDFSQSEILDINDKRYIRTGSMKRDVLLAIDSKVIDMRKSVNENTLVTNDDKLLTVNPIQSSVTDQSDDNGHTVSITQNDHNDLIDSVVITVTNNND